MRRIPVLLLCACACALAQTTPVAFTNARVIPISGPEIPSGTVVIQNGRILAVGATGSTTIPSGAQRVDATGKVIMPGLVDSHSHIGGPEGGDASAAIQPDVRILDSLNPRAASISKARAGGVTTANVMPGSGHLLSGQTLYLKLRSATVIDDLLIQTPDGRIAGGMKMANGTNPRRAAPFPGTRGKAAAMMREQLVKAQEYRDKVKAAGTDATKLPPRDLRMEGLAEVLEGKRTVHFHTHRQDDILTALRLSKEFHFRIVLQHVSDAWMVADEIAKSGAPSSIILIDSPGGKLETKDTRFENGIALEKVGALVGFHTDDGVTDSRYFLRMAGLAVRAGMSRDKALYGMTMAGARMLELDKRVGSLEAGKDADIIILSGDPLSIYSHVLETYVEGKRVFDRSDAKDRLFATGGFGASNGEVVMIDDEQEDQ